MLQQGVHPGWGCTHAAVGKGAASMLQRRGGGAVHPGSIPPFPHVNRMTHTCENITFIALLRNAVGKNHHLCRVPPQTLLLNIGRVATIVVSVNVALALWTARQDTKFPTDESEQHLLVLNNIKH